MGFKLEIVWKLDMSTDFVNVGFSPTECTECVILKRRVFFKYAFDVQSACISEIFVLFRLT